MERNFIIERTHAGLEAAKARGMLGGRPAKLTFKEKEMLFSLYKEKKYKRIELCERFDLDKSTFHRYLNEVQAAELERKIKENKAPEIQPLQPANLENLIVTFKQTSLF
jgi:DNA invertase Pin-like site-specific DNA recombinase